jgi:hypothetical protein
VEAHASVVYPVDWSRKGEVDQRAHLSTIDVLVLSAQLSEVYLAHTLGLRPEQRRRMRLSKVRIKAGTSPVEDDLVDFPACARVVESRPLPPGDSPGRATELHCTVGTLQVWCEVRHDAGEPSAAEGRYRSPEQLLGAAGARLFGDGYKARRQFVEHVDVRVEDRAAHAVVRITGSETAAVSEGLEGDYSSHASMIDCFVVGLQLGQVLLYELDGISRAESSTLWMRSTVLDRVDAPGPLGASVPATVVLEKCKILETAKRQVWRSVDIVTEFQGIKMRCSVAHIIS